MSSNITQNMQSEIAYLFHDHNSIGFGLDMHQSQLSAKETLSRIDTVQVAERLFFALDSVATCPTLWVSHCRIDNGIKF